MNELNFKELEVLVDALMYFRRNEEAMKKMGHNEEEVSHLRARLRRVMGMYERAS